MIILLCSYNNHIKLKIVLKSTYFISYLLIKICPIMLNQVLEFDFLSTNKHLFN